MCVFVTFGMSLTGRRYGAPEFMVHYNPNKARKRPSTHIIVDASFLEIMINSKNLKLSAIFLAIKH